jgi:hypothetical protein
VGSEVAGDLGGEREEEDGYGEFERERGEEDVYAAIPTSTRASRMRVDRCKTITIHNYDS